MKFSITDFFCKCYQILSVLPILSLLLKKSLIENFIFCAVFDFFVNYHVQSLRFCFIFLLQIKFNEIISLWNSHSLGRERNRECPSGRPLVMFGTKYSRVD